MKKEVFLAISIGFALGLIITFGIWTANKSLKNAKLAASPSPSPTTVPATPTTQTPTTTKLTITSPEDEALVNTPSVVLTGKTDAGSTVVLTYEDNAQQMVIADASGNFSATIDLVAGYNTINITSFAKDGTSTTQSLTVTYSTAKI